MRQFISESIKERSSFLLLSTIALLLVGGLMLYRLGNLTGGMSQDEIHAAVMPLGWHGIYQQPLYLPLQALRSIVFFISPHHGQTLTRISNAVYGVIAVFLFAAVLKLWHGTRTTILGTCLFAVSAWTLHVSRLASYDVLYLLVIPLLLLSCIALQRYGERPYAWYGSMLAWGLLLYIPGMVWVVALTVFWERHDIQKGWSYFNRHTERLMYLLSGAIWLPLLIIDLLRPGNLRIWTGLPAHFTTPLHSLKEFAAVFVHLFIRGPEYPQLWLAKAPVLDVFVLCMFLIGMYFYLSHWKANRSRLLISFFLIGVVLIALGGPVSLSLLVPLLYISAAAGIAYLIREWLQVFPLNPLARGLGLALISLAVALSCFYNLRAYFVAWPHNTTTEATFRYRR